MRFHVTITRVCLYVVQLLQVPPPEPATGSCECVDQDGEESPKLLSILPHTMDLSLIITPRFVLLGIIVRPGGRIAPRRASITSGALVWF